MVMTAEQAHQRRWWTLAVLCLSLTVISLDNTILNVALPSIVESLGAKGSQLQWIIDAYTIVFACLLLTAGSLGDKLGRKGVLTVGLTAFAACSAFASTASSTGTLIFARGLMGIGGALIFPTTLSILTNTFQGKERAKAIGIWAGVAGLGIAVGPLAGGLLVEHFWWGSVFLVNVPVCALAVGLGWFLIPTSKDTRDSKLDPMGAVLSIVGLVGLLYGIIQAPDSGWGAPEVLAGFAVGLVFLALFAAWELRYSHPMLDVRFFKNPRFSAASATITLVYFALFGSTFLLTQYFQFVLAYSPFKAGLMTAPVAIGIMAMAPNAPKLVFRIGTKKVVVLGLLVVAGSVALYASDTLMSSVWWGGAVRVIFGVGMGLTIAPATESIMGSLPRAKAGVGSAVNDTTRQTGGALGVAVIGSVFAGRYHALIRPPAGVTGSLAAATHDSIGTALKAGSEALKAGRISPAAFGQIKAAADQAYLGSMRVAVGIGAVIVLCAAVVAWRFLPARGADHDEEVPTLAPAPNGAARMPDGVDGVSAQRGRPADGQEPAEPPMDDGVLV